MNTGDIAKAPPGIRIAGVVLAGGEARRLNEKPFRLLGDRPLIGHVIDRARRQVGTLAISVRADTDRFKSLALPLVTDANEESLGPVAGLAAALGWAGASGASLLATFPCDAPFLPLDLVERLDRERGSDRVAVAASGGRIHPPFALWDTALADFVREALLAGERRLRRMTELAGATVVNFADADAFANLNSEVELRAAERLLPKTPG